MQRKVVRAVVAFVIAAIFLCPVSELFDRWDHTAKTGKDSESAVMLVAECAGAAIVVLHSASGLLMNFVAARPVAVFRSAGPRLRSFESWTNRFPESPPLLPLRI